MIINENFKLNESKKLDIGPNDVIVHKNSKVRYEILKPQSGQVQVLNLQNKTINHIANDYLNSDNFYVEESINESVNNKNNLWMPGDRVTYKGDVGTIVATNADVVTVKFDQQIRPNIFKWDNISYSDLRRYNDL